FSIANAIALQAANRIKARRAPYAKAAWTSTQAMKIAASACANAVGFQENPIAVARMPAMDSQSTVCCCARAVIGHVAAALPRSVMNPRRLIGSSEAQDKPQYRFKQALRKGRLSGQPCPLWVTSRHLQCKMPMSALPLRVDMKW